MKHIFTSESVTEGHPDKICDCISDAILDECLKQDPESRVAVEALAKTGLILLAGELSTNAVLDFQSIVRSTLKDIGYTDSRYGIDGSTCAVLVQLDKQSSEIADGVNAKEGKEQGAGDQGLMFGFACDDTEELMPLPITLAHSLAKKLSDVRKSKQVSYLGPDGKCQVSVEYDDDKPVRLNTVLISAQHDAGVSIEEMKRDLIENVIMPVCADYFQDDTKVLINPSGKFVLGGPHADAGLTGRKIIVDTYGGMGRHGGGAFSGKDASKVDRSGAYMARYIAKNLVASGFCRKCEVQLAYAIGKPNPVSVYVNTFNTGKVSDDMFSKIVRDVFPLKPAEIIQHLKLKSAGFKSTSAYGHFGRNRFTWEKVDKVAELKEKLSSHCL